MSSSLATGSRRISAIDEAIHALPIEWFRPSRAIYWTDLLAAATIGWAAFAWAVAARSALDRAAFLAVAMLALYRAVLFIHELTHLARRDVPWFRLACSALVGVPLLIPAFLYEGVHTEHHRQRSYGTEADPEYFPYGRRRPILILISLGASLLAPLALAVRFGVLAPVSWIVPPLGRMVRERASALAINPRFVRRTPISAAGRVEEAAACAVVWMAVSLWWNGHLPTSAFACWAATVAVASGVNAVRTLAAHRYDRDEGELRMIDQLVDSCTIDGGRGRRMLIIGHTLVAPLGLRFHALHHWIPSLPYHNLGRAHRRLVAALGGDAPYRATVERGFSPILRDLVRRSRRSRL